MDRLVPASLFSANLFVRFFNPVDAEGYGHVKVRTFVKDPCHVGKYSLMDLPVRHQINRVEFFFFVKRTDDLWQVLSREWLATGKDQHAEISAESFRDLCDLVGLHLQFL